MGPKDKMGFPNGSADKEHACKVGDTEDVSSIPWRRQPPPALLQGKSHGQRRVAGCCSRSSWTQLSDWAAHKDDTLNGSRPGSVLLGRASWGRGTHLQTLVLERIA